MKDEKKLSSRYSMDLVCIKRAGDEDGIRRTDSYRRKMRRAVVYFFGTVCNTYRKRKISLVDLLPTLVVMTQSVHCLWI